MTSPPSGRTWSRKSAARCRKSSRPTAGSPRSTIPWSRPYRRVCAVAWRLRRSSTKYLSTAGTCPSRSAATSERPPPPAPISSACSRTRPNRSTRASAPDDALPITTRPTGISSAGQRRRLRCLHPLRRRDRRVEQGGESLEPFGVGSALQGGKHDEDRSRGSGHRVGVPVQVDLSCQRVVDAHPPAGGFRDVVTAPERGELGAAVREVGYEFLRARVAWFGRDLGAEHRGELADGCLTVRACLVCLRVQ